MTVAEKVRKLRGEIKMEKFAEHVGVSLSLISYIESGKRKPGLRTAKALANFSGKPLDYFVD